MRAAFPDARGEDARGVLGIGALAFALFGAVTRQPRQLGLHRRRGEFHLTRGRALARFLPFGQLGEQPTLGLFGLGDVRPEHLRPRPAQALQRLDCAPRAFALEPFGVLTRRNKRASGQLEHFRHGSIVLRHRQAQRFGQPARGRHAETGGVDEGESLQQIEAREVRIAQPARHQRRVEHQHRRIGGGHDRIALRHGIGAPVGCTQPMTTVAGVERRQGQSVGQGIGRGHSALNGRATVTCKRKVRPLCPAGCPTARRRATEAKMASDDAVTCRISLCPSATGFRV